MVTTSQKNKLVEQAVRQTQSRDELRQEVLRLRGRLRFMKNKLKTTIGVAALLLATINTNAGLWSDIGEAASQFFANNPTNAWDASVYGQWNRSNSKPDLKYGLGAGTRVGYWLNPSVGAALDLSYSDSSWTFASVGLAARGTINVGNLGTVSPYAVAGPGWNITGGDNGAVQSVVAVAGAGATVHINKLKWFDLFGEYTHITTIEGQDQVRFGLTRRF